MEDRFKFRVWDKKQRKYNKLFNAINRDGRLITGWVERLEFANLDDFIIEQCTGLKDKNNQIFWEGDRVKCSKGVLEKIGTVVFENGCFWVSFDNEEGIAVLYQANKLKAEIIGNIHEKESRDE